MNDTKVTQNRSMVGAWKEHRGHFSAKLEAIASRHMYSEHARAFDHVIMHVTVPFKHALSAAGLLSLWLLVAVVRWDS